MEIINRIYQYKPNGKWPERPRIGGRIDHVVIHHSAMPFDGRNDDSRIQAMANNHINRDWPGLSYCFVIGQSGAIYQINNTNDLTWTDSWNKTSLAICVDGHFHNNDEPTESQLKALDFLVGKLRSDFNLGKEKVIAHRDISKIHNKPEWATACCGDNLYKNILNYQTNETFLFNKSKIMYEQALQTIQTQYSEQWNLLAEDEKNAFTQGLTAEGLLHLVARINGLRSDAVSVANQKIEVENQLNEVKNKMSELENQSNQIMTLKNYQLPPEYDSALNTVMELVQKQDKDTITKLAIEGARYYERLANQGLNNNEVEVLDVEGNPVSEENSTPKRVNSLFKPLTTASKFYFGDLKKSVHTLVYVIAGLFLAIACQTELATQFLHTKLPMIDPVIITQVIAFLAFIGRTIPALKFLKDKFAQKSKQLAE